ncbi:YceD family protein [Nafulsella turpanensis]|uniref:YceD family protein n=1 Tax=Nafulsella turpanensis TaxID=1265690 RepID=UPI00034CB1CF|nr:DUF177 domain-containing protein [Nafulsella turpanensis]
METKVKRQFDIEIFRIADGEHTYEMEVNDAFFALFDYGLVEKGNARAEVVLNKSTRMLTLDIHVEGQVELTCDRSLETFDYPINLDERLIVKYGEEEVELDDDILVITQNTQKINLAQFIYEIIGISLPMKKIHPDYLEEEDEDEFDELSEGRLVYSSMEEGEETEDDEAPEEDTTDPRWAILKNLKNN